MTIENVEHKQGMSIFTIYEPRRYGEPDAQYEVQVSHDPAELAKLSRITTKEISTLPNDAHGAGIEEVDSCEKLPTGETIVFKRVYDTDDSSVTYRHGAYGVVGQYFLVEETKQNI